MANTQALKIKLTARRVRGGCIAADSSRILDELIAQLDGDNLALALAYNGFATTCGAEQAARQLRGA